MSVLLMGMPGVGKGTQAGLLKQGLGVPHVSTGDLLREAVRDASSLGRKVREYVDSGRLVPDDLMGELIVDRLGQPDTGSGFILDGFPRTREQVTILDRVLQRLGIELDGVLLLGAPEEEVVRRLSGRRVCPQCAAVYHLETNPPHSAGVCDACSSALVQRPDDTKAVILDRVRVFREQTMPIAETYRRRSLLRQVEAAGDQQSVYGRLKEALGRS
jgi:adenylate kinase